MSSGKGGGGGTNSADIEIERRRQIEREANRQREEQAKQQALQNRVQTWDRNYAQALPDARNRYTTSLQNRGITDPNDLSMIISRAIGDVNRRIPNDTSSIEGFDPNVAAYFTDEALDNTYGRVRDERRQLYGTQVSNTFAPGMENELLPTTLDDPFVDAFLGSQRTDAMSMLERAKARGNLDTTGYNRGIQRIDELGAAGRSEAQKISDAIIAAGRGELRGVANRASADASAYELGRQFSVDRYQDDWNSTLNNFRDNLEGSVRSGLEGQDFFDIGDIITQSGIRQGAQNPGQAQADAVAARQRIRDAERGIGGGGQF